MVKHLEEHQIHTDEDEDNDIFSIGVLNHITHYSPNLWAELIYGAKTLDPVI